MPTTLEIWNHIQRQLFPVLVEEFGSLTERDRQFVEILGLVPLGPFLEPYRWGGIGTGQQSAQGALWRTFCARTRCKQSDGALDVWTDRSDRNATVSTDPLTNDRKLKRQTRPKPGAAVVPCPREKQIDAKPLRKSTQTRLGGRLNKSSYRKVESRIRYCPNGLNFARGS